MIELIFFAAVAIWLINMLLASLGATNHEDLIYRKSSPRQKNIKDVTNTGTKFQNNAGNVHPEEIEQYLSPGHDAQLIATIQHLSTKMPNFSCEHFMDGVKQVFTILTRNLDKLDGSQITQLLDRGFIENFRQLADKYQDMTSEQLLASKAYLSEIYFFGNKVYNKVEFIFNAKDKEYWTFTRNLNSVDPGWHLSNIQRTAN